MESFGAWKQPLPPEVNRLAAAEGFRLSAASFFYYPAILLLERSFATPLAIPLFYTVLRLADLLVLLLSTLADRLERRRLMVGVVLLQAVLVLLAVPLTLLSVLLFYPLGFLLSALDSVRGPAVGAYLADLVPRQNLDAARGRLGAAYDLGETLVGPPAAVLAGASPALALTLGSSLILLSTWLYRGLPPKPLPPVSPFNSTELWKGLAYLRAAPRGLLLLLLLENLVLLAYMGIGVLLPLLVLRHLGEGPLVLGLYGMAEGVGGVLGGLAVGYLLVIGRAPLLALSLLLMGILGFLLPLAPWTIGLLLLLGFDLLFQVFVAVAGAYRTALVSREIRARGLGAMRFIGSLLAPVGPLLAGGLVYVLGLVGAIQALALLLILAAPLALCLRLPEK